HGSPPGGRPSPPRDHQDDLDDVPVLDGFEVELAFQHGKAVALDQRRLRAAFETGVQSRDGERGVGKFALGSVEDDLHAMAARGWISGRSAGAGARMAASQSFHTGSSPMRRRWEATSAAERVSEMSNCPAAGVALPEQAASAGLSS